LQGFIRGQQNVRKIIAGSDLRATLAPNLRFRLSFRAANQA
jgi:hypothetical protein